MLLVVEGQPIYAGEYILLSQDQKGEKGGEGGVKKQTTKRQKQTTHKYPVCIVLLVPSMAFINGLP